MYYVYAYGVMIVAMITLDQIRGKYPDELAVPASLLIGLFWPAILAFAVMDVVIRC